MEFPGCETLVRNAYYRHPPVDVPVEGDFYHLVYCARFREPLLSSVREELRRAARDVDAILERAPKRSAILVNGLRPHEHTLMCLSPQVRREIHSGLLLKEVPDLPVRDFVAVYHMLVPRFPFTVDREWLESQRLRTVAKAGSGTLWKMTVSAEGNDLPSLEILNHMIEEGYPDGKRFRTSGTLGAWSERILESIYPYLLGGWQELHDKSEDALEDVARMYAMKILSAFGTPPRVFYGSAVGPDEIEDEGFGPN